MQFNSVMLDIETMGTAKDAAIISIGAVRFNREASAIGDTFHQTINLKSAQAGGGKIDANTVMWWLNQSQEARDAILKGEGVHIETALKQFNEWVRMIRMDELWGNGADFDNVILEGAYLRLGWTPPWTYKMNRCYRTMFNLFPNVKYEPEPGFVAHDAVHDAMAQAKHLCKINQGIVV